MKRLIFLLIILISTLNSNESSYNKGRNLYFDKACSNCHGSDAQGSSYYPKLANLSKKYLIKKLTQFQKGISTSQKQEIMFGFARSLNKKELDDITTYLSNYKDENSDKYEVSDDILGSVD
jgi:cytochrome c553